MSTQALAARRARLSKAVWIWNWQIRRMGDERPATGYRRR